MKEKAISPIQEILIDSSRLLAEKAGSYIGQNKKRVSEAISLCILDKYPISMRTARALQLWAPENPKLLIPHLNLIMKMAAEAKTEGVRRCFMKILSELPYLENLPDLGILVDRCFTVTLLSKEAISVRAYAMDILDRLSEKEPGLREEFIFLLEQMTLAESIGLRTRARKMLKKATRRRIIGLLPIE